MSVIAVVETAYNKAQHVFNFSEFDCYSAPADEKGLVEVVRSKGARHVIVGPVVYKDLLYQTLPTGGVIARYGVGHDNIDMQKAEDAGLYVTNTPEVLTDSVAEYTMGLITSAARHFTLHDRDLRNGTWTIRIGSELAGKTLAIIGCGDIGKRVAQIARFGYRMDVVGLTTRPVDENKYRDDYGFRRVTQNFEQAVSEADFISVHIPGGEETKHYFNQQRLKALPAFAWLINMSRGSVVDESALFTALKSGTLAGAALDVFENEPYEPVSENQDLRRLDNVVLQPHAASSTHQACNRMAERALQNIRYAEEARTGKMDLLNRPKQRKNKGI